MFVMNIVDWDIFVILSTGLMPLKIRFKQGVVKQH